jgi:hypothetical protein
VDGVDRSDLYKDLSIDFGNGVYSAKNGMPVWKESGKWKFLNDEAHFLILDDDVEMEILSITDKRLELSFQWSIDSFEAGRIKSVKGKNKFTLIR